MNTRYGCMVVKLLVICLFAEYRVAYSVVADHTGIGVKLDAKNQQSLIGQLDKKAVEVSGPAQSQAATPVGLAGRAPKKESRRILPGQVDPEKDCGLNPKDPDSPRPDCNAVVCEAIETK